MHALQAEHVPRFDSQLSLHQDVANFLSCLRLSLVNPTLTMDEHQLNKCVGFSHLFPHVDGITQQVWGPPMGALPSTSQQGMLLWMQDLQKRVDDATAKNLDRAAAAFGPCEEARLARGVSGRSDVEGVRQDLEYWIGQHEELSKRLRNQRKYIRALLQDTRSVSASTAGNKAGGDSPFGARASQNGPFEDDDDLYFYQQRTLERQQQQQMSKKNSRNPQASWDITVDKLYNTRPKEPSQRHNSFRGGDDGLNLSRHSSFQMGGGGPAGHLSGLVDGLRPTNSDFLHAASAANKSARSDDGGRSDVSRSTSGNTVGHVQESLGAELLALQSMRQRVEGIAETREKLVKAMVSLGSPARKIVRTATNPQF